MKVKKTKDVWIVRKNTDNTEGRGFHYVGWVCETKATALRLAKGAYVQGTDCPVYKGKAIYIDNVWYIPGSPEKPSEQDDVNQKKLEQLKVVLDKAKSAGLTEDDLKVIRNL